MGCGATKDKTYVHTASGAATVETAAPTAAETAAIEAAPVDSGTVTVDDTRDTAPKPPPAALYGLKEFLESAGLGKFEAEGLRKCEDEGIGDLAMLLQKEAWFSTALGLKPLERKRLRKALDRSGDGVPLEPLTLETVTGEYTLPEGLAEAILEAQLEHLRSNAASWCEQTGAVYLTEVCEHVDHFAHFLNLSRQECEFLCTALHIALPGHAGQQADLPLARNDPVAGRPLLGKQMSTVTISSTPSIDCLIELFEEFDLDGSGYVKSDELKHWFASLSGDLTDEEAEELLRFASPDADGLVDYVDFVRELAKTPKASLTRMISHISQTPSTKRSQGTATASFRLGAS